MSAEAVTAPSTTRLAARAYAGAGRRVFPVCRDKRPLTTHGKNDATSDIEIIDGWWTRWP